MNNFPEVSLLVTHYNRSRSLENLLTSFKALECNFGEIIISDDASSKKHQSHIKYLQTEFEFNLVTTTHNSGLGNNINKGQDAVSTPYTLYVQEDFEPSNLFPEKLKAALKFLCNDQELDIVRFYAYTPYPYVEDYSPDFYKMNFKVLGTRYKKIHYYSDHPHLRRTEFLQKFGRYPEGISGDETEYNMSISFLQKKGKGLIYKDCYALFTQRNTNEEPSTMIREGWIHRGGLFNKFRRLFFRQFKYNFDVNFKNLRSR